MRSLVVLLLACHSAPYTASSHELTEVAQFERLWDLAFIYPVATSQQQVDAMVGASELLPEDTLRALMAHSRGEVWPADRDQDEVITVPKSESTEIENEECIKNPASWRVTQVRVGPYELAVPGTVSAYEGLDRVIELRVTLHAYCVALFDAAQLDIADQAHHVIFYVVPEGSSIIDTAKQFAALQAAGKKSQSYAALNAHAAALSAPEYAAFRRDFFAELRQLADIGHSQDFSALDQEVTSFQTDLVSRRRSNAFGLLQDPLAHPGLASPSGAQALRNFILRWAKPNNLARTASMFTVGEQDAEEFGWFFSAMSASNGTLTPARLRTFVAVKNEAGVDVTQVSDAGYFSEARGLFSGPKFRYPASLRAEVLKVDTGRDAMQDEDDALAVEGNARWAENDELKADLRKFHDPAHTNATTTTCDKCHNALNVEKPSPTTWKLANTREHGAYDFHAIKNSLNLRTVLELPREIERLNAELRRVEQE